MVRNLMGAATCKGCVHKAGRQSAADPVVQQSCTAYCASEMARGMSYEWHAYLGHSHMRCSCWLQGAYGERCQALAVSHELSPPPASVERDLDNVTEHIFDHHDGLLETVPLCEVTWALKLVLPARRRAGQP